MERDWYYTVYIYIYTTTRLGIHKSVLRAVLNLC